MKTYKLSGAFVLRLRIETDFAVGKVEGFAEHVESGRGVQFHSLDTLIEFLGDELAHARAITGEEKC